MGAGAQDSVFDGVAVLPLNRQIEPMLAQGKHGVGRGGEGEHGRRVAVDGVLGIDVGAESKADADAVGVAFLDGDHERRAPVMVVDVDARAALEEHAQSVGLSVARGFEGGEERRVASLDLKRGAVVDENLCHVQTSKTGGRGEGQKALETCGVGPRAGREQGAQGFGLAHGYGKGHEVAKELGAVVWTRAAAKLVNDGVEVAIQDSLFQRPRVNGGFELRV